MSHHCPVCRAPAAAGQRPGRLLVDVVCAACGGQRCYSVMVVKARLPAMSEEQRVHLSETLRVLPDPLPEIIEWDTVSHLLQVGPELAPSFYGKRQEPEDPLVAWRTNDNEPTQPP